jgi:hypothetical protein
MERKSIIISIVVVALVLGFITELFYLNGSFSLPFLGGTSAPPQNVTGTTIFNGTIRTYNPVLEIPANISSAVLSQLYNLSGVKIVQPQANDIIIQTETRDDVYPLAVALGHMNVSGILTVANIVMPENLEVDTQNGTINASTLDFSGVMQVVTEPFVDSDSTVPVSMTAVVSGGMLIDYYNAQILAQSNRLSVNATSLELSNTTFTYSIPWAGRASIPLALLNSSNSSYRYDEVNTLIFSPPLTVSQVLADKQLPYITFIGTASAEAAANFSNESAVRSDFSGTNVTFPDSTLIVSGLTEPSLNYTPAVVYSYLVGLPSSAGGYDLGNSPSFTLQTSAPLQVNATVPLNVTVLVIGDQVLSVTPS